MAEAIKNQLINTRPTLLVLAAGMATRYGSLKQMDHFGPEGETLMDYAIYDAIKAGFGKVVFVIRDSIAGGFQKEVLNKFSDKILVDYVYQELEHLPEGFSVPENRVRPWGTGHAVWVAAPKVNTPFAVINADDFYGYSSFKLIADFLKNKANAYAYGLVGYQLKNTLSPHGAVSRGICKTNNEGYLESVTEQTHITQTKYGITIPDKKSGQALLKGDEIVSMNLMGFSPAVFPYFEAGFKEFLNTQNPDNPKAEFYLPEVVNSLVKTGKAKVKVLPSSEKWFGVTFSEDKPIVIQNLRDLIAQNLYPGDLWASPLKQS